MQLLTQIVKILFLEPPQLTLTIFKWKNIQEWSESSKSNGGAGENRPYYTLKNSI